MVNSRFGISDAGTTMNAYKNGLASFVEKTDLEAIERAKSFIGFISEPSSDDDFNRLVPELDSIISADNYDMKKIIEAVADSGKVLYMCDGAAENILTALVNLGGEICGIVANQPAVKNGSLDSSSAKKAARFRMF